MVQAAREFFRKGTDTWFLGCKKADLTSILTEIWGGTNTQHSLRHLTTSCKPSIRCLFCSYAWSKRAQAHYRGSSTLDCTFLPQTYHFTSLNLLLFYKWHHQKVYRGPLSPRPPCAFWGALPFRAVGKHTTWPAHARQQHQTLKQGVYAPREEMCPLKKLRVLVSAYFCVRCLLSAKH